MSVFCFDFAATATSVAVLNAASMLSIFLRSGVWRTEGSVLQTPLLRKIDIMDAKRCLEDLGSGASYRHKSQGVTS